jgi:hypothetical protein
MGFMVDNVNFRNMAPEQQVTLMEEMPMFVDDLEAFDRQQTAAREGGLKEDSETDIPELAEDVVELQELAESGGDQPAHIQVVSKEGLSKIIKLFSSF